jgi:hypothetical protein
VSYQWYITTVPRPLLNPDPVSMQGESFAMNQSYSAEDIVEAEPGGKMNGGRERREKRESI